MYRFEVYFLEDILTHRMQKMQFIILMKQLEIFILPLITTESSGRNVHMWTLVKS